MLTRSNPEDHRAFRLFRELLAIPSPSGHERRMAEHLANHVAQLGLPSEIDPAGNVLVRLAGRSAERPTICYAAHCDEIGATVTAIRDGALRVTRLGGLQPWKLGESPVTILGDRRSIGGMFSLGSGHSRAVVDRGPSWEAVTVFTGRTSQQLQDAGVRVGSPVIPDRSVCGPFLFGDPETPWVGAWTFDNRLSVACVLACLERFQRDGVRPLSPTIIAFTVEEEVGCLGAKALAQRERPDIFIAVDGSPLVPECPLQLDGSLGIRSRDRAAIYDQDLLQRICKLSADAGVIMQSVVYEGAASDASLVYSIGASPQVACFGYVRASSHGYEVAPLQTFDSLTGAVGALLQGL